MSATRTIEERARGIAANLQRARWLAKSNVSDLTAEQYVTAEIETEFADVVTSDPRVVALVEAAQDILTCLDNLTTDQFSLGSEKPYRDRLNAALVKFGQR